jgi:UTP--glucose-1-phosphate uridylyltransferase
VFCPATKAMPKEMLTVVDRPLIQHVVDEAREAGIEHLRVRHRSQQGRDRGSLRPAVRTRQSRCASAAKKSGDWSCSIAKTARTAGATSFTRQQAPLGLGHAVWCARDTRRRRAVRGACCRTNWC